MHLRSVVTVVAAVVSMSAHAQSATTGVDSRETAPRDRSPGAGRAPTSVEGEPGTAAGPARVSVSSAGVEVAPPHGGYVLEIGGRLHVDWARHSGDTGPAKPVDGTELRRARISIGAELDGPWRTFGEADFAGGDVTVKDLWIAYDVADALRVTLGQQKQPYNLGLEMSSNDIPFVERGVDNALVEPFVDRAVGVRVDLSRGRWFFAGGVFGEPIDDEQEGWGTAARVIVAPVTDAETTLHLGFRVAYREPAADAGARIESETTSFSELAIVDTGPIAGADAVTLYGPRGRARDRSVLGVRRVEPRTRRARARRLLVSRLARRGHVVRHRRIARRRLRPRGRRIQTPRAAQGVLAAAGQRRVGARGALCFDRLERRFSVRWNGKHDQSRGELVSKPTRPLDARLDSNRRYRCVERRARRCRRARHRHVSSAVRVLNRVISLECDIYAFATDIKRRAPPASFSGDIRVERRESLVRFLLNATAKRHSIEHDLFNLCACYYSRTT